MILPCPFCGADDVELDTSDEVFRRVTCNTCGAAGPNAGSEDSDDYAQIVAAAERDAIEGWNAARRDAKRYRRVRKASGG